MLYSSAAYLTIDDLLQSATDGMVKKVKDKGSNLSYEVFRAVVDEVISQDQDMASFVFVLHLFSNVLSTIQQLPQVYPKTYIGEKYADEAVSIHFCRFILDVSPNIHQKSCFDFHMKQSICCYVYLENKRVFFLQWKLPLELCC